MYGAFDVVLYFVIIQLCWLLINLLLILSYLTSTSAMSSFTTSIHLLFGLPRFLFPGKSILSILLPIYQSYFLRTCPYNLSLASRIFSPNRPNCAVPLMYSFLILSNIVTPNDNRNIFRAVIYFCIVSSQVTLLARMTSTNSHQSATLQMCRAFAKHQHMDLLAWHCRWRISHSTFTTTTHTFSL